MKQGMSVREKLIQAAHTCFLDGDYHQVSTRRIAETAGVNVSMIRYYFGSKGGLYEAMLKATLEPFLEALDGRLLETPGGFESFFHIYYQTMSATPAFPKLLLKVLTLQQGPGKRFLLNLLERGRRTGAQTVNALKLRKQVDQGIEADIVRLSFVSLAMMPMLLMDVLEAQRGSKVDASFLNALATFNGRLFENSKASANGARGDQ